MSASFTFDPNCFELRARRFWILVCGSPVRICLRLGETITIEEGGATEEGYYSRSETYTIQCGFVIREIYTDSSDCDGRMKTHSRYSCRVCDLSSEMGSEDLCKIVPFIHFPNWKKEKSGQRDYSAEAAGY